jgi:SMODS and SLOG-associating 2TM effector domain 1/Protein of unknown function (DUF4231)
MTSGNISHTLEEVWSDRKIWSLTANQLKKSLTFWRGTALLLTILGAILETLAAQLPNLPANGTTAIGSLGAIALVLVPIIRTAKLGSNQTKSWLRSRSVSEGLKTEIYLYLTGTQPYEDQTLRDSELSRQHHDIVQLASDLYRNTAQARSQVAKEKPTPPQPMDVNTYIRERINSQIEGYYEPKAAELARQSKQLRLAEFWSSVAAAMLGVVPKFFEGSAQFSAWVAVVTTVGVAITAHLAAGRFDYIIDSYLATADRLKSFRNQWLDGQKQGATQNASQFISECERAISVENEGWMAKFLQSDE